MTSDNGAHFRLKLVLPVQQKEEDSVPFPEFIDDGLDIICAPGLDWESRGAQIACEELPDLLMRFYEDT